MKKIFLSYSRHNMDTVEMLVNDLKAVGNNVWYDKALTGGQRWWDNILSNIRDCDIFILVISTDSLESEACNCELNYAIQLGIGILPVIIDHEVHINLLPHPLNEFQITDYLIQDRQSIFALIKAISSLPEKSPAPSPLPEPPPVPISYLITLKERIETKDTLDFNAQISLVFELRNRLKECRSPEEVIDLFNLFKQRNDLLAKVASEIDAVLADFQNAGMQHEPEASTDSTKQTDEIETEVDNSETDIQNDKAEQATTSKICLKCNNQNHNDAIFCCHCGADFSAASKENMLAGEATQSRRFLCRPEKYQQLITDVEQWLRSINFDCQKMQTENQGVLIQIKKSGSWRKFIGMSTALNIVFNQEDNNLCVEIGAGKWMDKAVVGTVSLFILWPLAVTAGIGAWQQSQMPETIFEFIETHINR